MSSATGKTVADNNGHESFMDHWLVMPKLLYFLLNMYVYAFHSLMVIFFVDQWHFSYFMFGYASSVVVANFFGSMIWTSLADKTGKYKTIIISTTVLYTIVALAMLVPVFEDPSQWLIRYVYVFVGLGLFNFFLSASFPLVDAQIMGMLAANPRVSKDQFGNQRLFGAFGHVAATICSFALYDKKNPSSQAIFQVVISIVFCLAVRFCIPDVKPVKGGHHGHHAAPSKDGKGEVVEAPKNPVTALFSNANFVFFLLFVAFSGIVRSVTTNYQSKVAQTVSGGNMYVAAFIAVFRTASEVFVYATAKYLKNWMGIYWVLVFSQVTGIIRLWGYGIIDTTDPMSYWYSCALELLKGFNSGLISSSAVAIASNLAPPGCESTAQGLYSGMYAGLSSALGGIISGAVLQHLYVTGTTQEMQIHDLQTLFRWVSSAASFVTLLLAAKYIFVDRVMGLPGFPRRHSFHPKH